MRLDVIESRARRADAPLAVQCDQITQSEWEQTVGLFEDAACDQTWCYGASLWGDRKLSHVVVKRDGAIIAAAQAVILRPGVLPWGMAYVKFGPMWRRRGTPADRRDLSAAIAALIDAYCVERKLQLVVLPQPNPDHDEAMVTELRRAGFADRGEMVDPNRYLVDLRLSEDEQMQSLQQKWRYNLRKSMKHDFAISAHRDADALETFRELYSAMIARKRFHDTSGFSGIDRLFGDLPPALRPHVVLARHKGRPVAGAIIGRLGDTASYLFGATNGEAQRLNAGYAMHWWITRWLSETNARWYDLQGDACDRGLLQFKKGLVGKRGRIHSLAGEFTFGQNFGSRLTADAIFSYRAARRSALSLRNVASKAAP